MLVKDYKNHYKTDAELFDYFCENKYDSDYNRRLHSFILRIIGKNFDGILDIGSGGGWLAKSSYKSKTLIDLSFRNLLKIKNEIDRENTNYSVSDALCLPFKEKMFNVVVMTEVLEHLNDPEKAIAESFRVLKNGGQIIISTPYKEKLKYYLCVHCNKATPANAHIHSFDENKISEYLNNIGIKNYKFRKFGNKLFLFSRLSYFFRFLPFTIWRIKDIFINIFYNNPNTLLVIITK